MMDNDSEKISADDKKTSDKKISRILAELNGKTDLFYKAKDFFSGIVEGVSLKYVLTVAGGVLFFIMLIVAQYTELLIIFI